MYNQDEKLDHTYIFTIFQYFRLKTVFFKATLFYYLFYGRKFSEIMSGFRKKIKK